jgi:glycopeptide antibiotics resistance protein
MSTWGWSAGIGIVFGVVSFGLTFFLVIAVQYRMYGRFTGLRLLGAGAGAVYLTTLVAYTLLPLPSSQATVCAPTLQLIPFHFISDILKDTDGDGLLTTLTSQATLQVVFNVLLFIPLGVIARGFLSRSLPLTVLIGLAASVIIEATQYTGIWGLYACPYRLADVDDVLTNTAGAAVGALLGPIALGWMPGQRELRATRGTPRPVTVRRRWLGMAIDLALFGTLGFCLTVPYVLLRVATDAAPGEGDPVSAALGSLVPALIVFIVPALRGTGASIGQSAVWLAPQWRATASRSRRLARALSVGGVYAVLVFVSNLSLPVSGAAGSLGTLVLLADLVAVPLTRGAAGLSGVATGAVMRDQREPLRERE